MSQPLEKSSMGHGSSAPLISLNGTVTVNYYSGSQPELIDGISSVPASDKPLIRHVYMVSTDIIGIIIDEKACILSNLRPYRKQKNDNVILTGYHGLSKLLVRNGDSLGYLAGRDDRWYRPFNLISGDSLDLKWISDPSNFTVSSADDPNYNSGISPLKIYRKSIPAESVTRMFINPKPLATTQHQIFFKLPAGLSPGKLYKISFSNGSPFAKDVTFKFDDEKLRSEAIHVNMYGYEPENRKTGFLSCWLGDGEALEYPGKMHFRIINVLNNKTVFEGEPKLKLSSEKQEYVVKGIGYNHNLTDVYEMDFSSLDKKGRYKLVVDGIGCSSDFLVDDVIWENTTRLLMKGYLHQRAGIELGPPYTDYIRPRNLHPADGHIIHKVDPEKYFGFDYGDMPRESNPFKRIKASILEDTSVPEAWGGWMDAGDYDRRMTHLYSVRSMMYLCELDPEYFESINFNIPESSNNIPDILDEGLWCLDLYKRTQGIYEEGGVSYRVESIEHPRQGETSWLNSLPTAIIPPTPEACIDYAGTAAQMAKILKKYDANLAAEYEKSAMGALKWVENHPETLAGRQDLISGQNLLYISFYRLTGEEKYHTRFQETLKEIYPNGINGKVTLRRLDAIAIYSMMDPSRVDKKLQDTCRAAVITMADDLLAGAGEETYGVLRSKSQTVSRLVTMSSKILPVVMAHSLTGDKKYTEALAKTIQYTMGLNPLNRTYISGLGLRSFMPYHHDWHADMLRIPSGIPNFGPTMQWWDSSYTNLDKLGLYPSDFKKWPLSESCFNQMWMAPVNEFTTESPMGELLLLTGYLASSSK